MNKLDSFVGKLWKGGLAGAVAQLGVVLASNNWQISSLADLGVFAQAVFVAVITGFTLGILKLLTWQK